MHSFSSILDNNEWDVHVFTPSSTRILLGDFGTLFLVYMAVNPHRMVDE